MCIFVHKFVYTTMKKGIYPNRLKEILASKGISNHWLADQLGVTDMTVSRWATNKNQPSITQLVNISRALNVDLASLVETEFNIQSSL